MKSKILGLLASSLWFVTAANATVIGSGAFISPTLIDFNDGNPANTVLGATYAGLGVANMTLCGGQTFKTGAAAASEVASNFFGPGCDPGPYGPGEITFSSSQVRVGFDITTNNADDTTIFAYLGATLVGSEFFDTFGAGVDGSFVGIEFLSGFDRIVISAATTTNGAFSIDNLRFEGAAVPEPGTLALLGLGLAGLGFSRRRKAN